MRMEEGGVGGEWKGKGNRRKGGREGWCEEEKDVGGNSSVERI